MRTLLLLGLASLLLACKPDFSARLSLIDRERVLAIQGEPAEVRPGERVRLRALVVAPGGRLDTTALSWSFCTRAKSLRDNNSVGVECLRGEGNAPIVSSGTQIDVSLPPEGCRLYGPDVPAGGQFRPRDADGSGGYYQPVRTELDGVVIHLQRIRCNLANAPVEVSRRYQREYQVNQNPAPPQLRFWLDGVELDPAAIPQGRTLVVRAIWSAESRETYLFYDPRGQALVERREAMRVSWFADAGEIEIEGSGLDEGQEGESAETRWRAPASPGIIGFWAVLRDSRGGLSFAESRVQVVP